MAITNSFQVSPGVNTKEIDISNIVGSVATTEGGLAGVYEWGPIGVISNISSEQNYVEVAGKPSNFNGETWFVGSSFLADSNQLFLSRAANTSGSSPIINVTTNESNGTILTTNTSALSSGMLIISATNVAQTATIASITNSTAFVVTPSSSVTASGSDTIQFVSNNSVFSSVANTGQVTNLELCMIKNETDYTTKVGTFDTDVKWIARCPGKKGDSLKLSRCDNSNCFTSSINLASYGATISLAVDSNTATVTCLVSGSGGSAQTGAVSNATSLTGKLTITDLLQFGNAVVGQQSLKITNISSITPALNATYGSATFSIEFEDPLSLSANQTSNSSITRYWEYYDLLDQAPGQSDYVRRFGNTAAQDETHIVVTDEDGLFTGVPGTVLEVYKNVSRATDAKLDNGMSNYFVEMINQNSKYVWYANDRSNAPSNTAVNVVSCSNNVPAVYSFKCGQNGSDENTISIGDLANAYDLFANPEDVDISLIMQGKARGGTWGAQLANYLIDNIATIRKDCVVFVSPAKELVVNNQGNEAEACVGFRNTTRVSSYGFMDSGYKYMYDRYNDVYRWVPLNGDIAGLAVRTDRTNDPWWSFAGFNRGQLKNVVKLAWNPRKIDRDILYKNNINPVVTFPQEGTVLYGDKTLQTKASAFDRINVRRLFIVLEKAISNAAKYYLFEFNDEITRTNFKNQLIPYLRNIKGRRGITDFLVVCDSTNNPGYIVDSNQFVGSIFVKPARSINFITLNFVAVGTDVNFSEVLNQV